jgi:hypothetical protein
MPNSPARKWEDEIRSLGEYHNVYSQPQITAFHLTDPLQYALHSHQSDDLHIFCIHIHPTNSTPPPQRSPIIMPGT